MRSGEQVPTARTTVREIMSRPYFALGVADRRAPLYGVDHLGGLGAAVSSTSAAQPYQIATDADPEGPRHARRAARGERPDDFVSGVAASDWFGLVAPTPKNTPSLTSASLSRQGSIMSAKVVKRLTNPRVLGLSLRLGRTSFLRNR
jgi:hypothetical protein